MARLKPRSSTLTASCAASAEASLSIT
jgi:hypothetical protein